MGPLLVGAAGLMWGRAAVAGPGPGGGLGALRLPPWGTVGRGRQLRRVAPAAFGDFGVVRQLRRVAPAACGDFGVVRQLRRCAPAALGDFGVDWGCLHNSRYYVAEF